MSYSHHNLVSSRRLFRLGLLATLLSVGCQQKMAVQPSVRPLEGSAFFDDGRGSRPLVEGTVPRGHLRDDASLYTGRLGKPAIGVRAAGIVAAFGGASTLGAPALTLAGEPYVAEFPFPITAEVMERGRERFAIFCAHCHDRTGSGQGMIVRRGFTRPPSFHIDRLRQAPHGYIFHVITSGYGAMPDHAAQVPVRDRWAIVAYVRALQLSQHAPLDVLPPKQRSRLTKEAGR